MTQEEQQGVSVHAGFPNPATESSVRNLDLNQLLVQHSVSTFYFRLRGSHWQALGIMDGDIAIVDRSLDARPADLVIWFREGESGFAISYFKEIPPQTAIWGIVTATIHQFRNTGTPVKQQKS